MRHDTTMELVVLYMPHRTVAMAWSATITILDYSRSNALRWNAFWRLCLQHEAEPRNLRYDAEHRNEKKIHPSNQQYSILDEW